MATMSSLVSNPRVILELLCPGRERRIKRDLIGRKNILGVGSHQDTSPAYAFSMGERREVAVKRCDLENGFSSGGGVHAPGGPVGGPFFPQPARIWFAP